MKKTAAIALFLSFTILAFIFWSHVERRLVTYVIRSQSNELFGAPLRYESLSTDGSLLSLNHVEIVDTRTDGEPGVQLHADRVDIAYQLSLFSRSVVAEVTLVRPVVVVDRAGASTFPSLDLSRLDKSFWDVSLALSMEDGTLRLIGGPVDVEARIEGDLSLDGAVRGSMACVLGPETEHGNTLLIDFDANDGEATVDLALQEVDASSFSDMLRFARSDSLAGWEILDGVLSGRLVTFIDREGTPSIDGEVLAEHLVVQQSTFLLGGSLATTRLQFNGLTPGLSDDEPQVIVQGTVSEPSTLVLYKDDEVLWRGEELEAQFQLLQNGELTALLEGVAFAEGVSSRLKVDAEARDLLTADPSLHVSLKLDSNLRDPVSADIRWQWDAEEEQLLSVDFQSVGPAEIAAAQAFLSPYHPGLKGYSLDSGVVSLRVVALGQPGEPRELRVDSLEAAHMAGTAKENGISFGAARLQAQGRFDLLGAVPMGTHDLSLSLEGGKLTMERSGEGPSNFQQIDARVTVKGGVIEASKVTGSLEGLLVELEVDEREVEEIATLKIKGTCDQVAPFCSPRYRSKVRRAFGSEPLTVSAKAVRGDDHTRLLGQLHLRPQNGPEDILVFGWKMSRRAPSAEQVYSGMSEQALFHRDMLPAYFLASPLFAPTQELYAEWEEDQLSWHGMEISDGWVAGENLPLKRFLSPFLFAPETNITLSGEADAKVTFDHHNLTIAYRGREVLLDGPKFAFDLGDIGDKDSLPGLHFFDFHQGTDFGFLPIAGGSYRDKNFGLVFEDVSGQLISADKQKHLIDVETRIKGIEMRGRVDFDHSSPEKGVAELDVVTSEMKGTFTQLTELLQSFGDDILKNVPLEGLVVSPKNGGRLHLTIRPIQTYTTGSVQGSILDCGMVTDNGRMLLDGCSLDFDYNSQDNTLTFENLAGKLQVGEEEDLSLYTLSCRNTVVSEFPEPVLTFDVRVEETTQDLIRLVGTGRATHRQREQKIFEFRFDPLSTSVGQIRPNITHLAVKNWKEVVALHAEPTVKLSSFLEDIRRFSQTGWFIADKGELDPLRDLDMEGRIRSVIDFDPLTTTFNFSAVGEDLSLGGTPIDSAFLSGKRTATKWSIEQFQLDSLSVAADLFPENDGWALRFVGVRYGTTFLAGLEGKYWPQQRSLLADINLLELSLDNLEELSAFAPLVDEWNPKGMIKGKGSLKLTMGLGGEEPLYEASLETTVDHLEVAGMHLEAEESIECRFRSDEGVAFEGIHGRITEVHGLPADLGVDIKLVQYEWDTSESLVEGCSFSIPAAQLPWLAQTLQATFPDKMNEPMIEALSHLKEGEPLIGTIGMTLSPSYQSLKLELDEGAYLFGGEPHQLRNFLLDYDPYEVKISTDYQFRDHYYTASARSSANALNYGQMTLGASQDADMDAEELPLVVFWEWGEELGFQVRRAEGNVAGMEVHLNSAPGEHTANKLDMVGQIHFDWRKTIPLFAQGTQDFIRNWKLGSGYELSGHFTLDKENLKNVWFEGSLLGRDYHLFGHQFRTMHGQVQVEPGLMKIDDFTMVDSAGTCRVPKATLEERDTDSWVVTVPSLIAEGVKPSRMQKVGSPVKEEKSLLVRKVELEGVEGTLGDSDSFSGSGHLSFINTSQRNLRNTLLAIPSELLLRIGLTADALTPVVGLVHFNVHDSRVFLTELEDVYSEGRASKFYFPSGPFQSNVDFGGNLNVQVKMKQYNLLFKIAELFTISIQGTLDHPTFSLKKKKDDNWEAYDGDSLMQVAG